MSGEGGLVWCFGLVDDCSSYGMYMFRRSLAGEIARDYVEICLTEYIMQERQGNAFISSTPNLPQLDSIHSEVRSTGKEFHPPDRVRYQTVHPQYILQ